MDIGILQRVEEGGGSAFGGFTCDFSFLLSSYSDHHSRSPISSAKERGAIPRTRVMHALWYTQLSRIQLYFGDVVFYVPSLSAFFSGVNDSSTDSVVDICFLMHMHFLMLPIHSFTC